MFPVTHLYLLSRLYPLNNFSILGAVFPDTCISGKLTWDESHCQGLEFWKSLLPKEKESLKPFVIGLFSHTVSPPGLDFYNDKLFFPHKEGYAFLKSAQLVEEVMSACSLNEEKARWKAHNFIEMAVESLLAGENPLLVKKLFSALNDEELITGLSEPLGRFYLKTPQEIAWGYEILALNLTFFPEKPRNLAQAFKRQLFFKHGVEQADAGRLSEIIIKARKLVKNDYKAFLSFSTGKIKAGLLKWLELA